jgi:P-type Cu+ transporter
LGICTASAGATAFADNDQEAPMSTDTVVDPVCGMSVAPETAAATREFDGTTYYFCSAGCAVSFDADPQRYASAQTGE